MHIVAAFAETVSHLELAVYDDGLSLEFACHYDSLGSEVEFTARGKIIRVSPPQLHLEQEFSLLWHLKVDSQDIHGIYCD